MNRKLLAAVVAIIIVACAAIAVVNLNDNKGDTIVVETSPDFAPFDYYYGDEFAGIDMDVIVKQVAVVLKDSTIDSLEDIKGKKLTVQTGTTGADYAETVSSDIVYQKAYADVVLDVLNGKADAEIVDDMVAQSQIAAHPELETRSSTRL